MILETLACSDFSRKPQCKPRRGQKKKGKSAPKKRHTLKPQKRDSRVHGQPEAVAGPIVKKGLKMDAKNVHSRAYHAAYRVAKNAGGSSAECREAACKAAKAAVANL